MLLKGANTTCCQQPEICVTPYLPHENLRNIYSNHSWNTHFSLWAVRAFIISHNVSHIIYVLLML